MRKLLLTLFFLAAGAQAQTAVIPLWPEGVPNAKANPGPEKIDGTFISNVSQPSLTYYPAAAGHAAKTAVIICPGGSYQFLAADHEGRQYAQWLSSLGVAAFVLKYRLADYGHPAPLQDVLRALRTVRAHAADYGVAPVRPAGSSNSVAALDAVSARPDFALLVYPVITLMPPFAHEGSRYALLGAHPTPEQVKAMSVETRVTAQTPPVFLVHAQDDGAVPVENSILFFQALTRAKVPAEMHLFERGGHGAGMGAGHGDFSLWPKRAEEWLRDHKLIQ
ncbi:alpha/beta hydrolase [Massilia sp. CT11-108]|uniref:alpha/beta hydrolase n=1 Tax=Massilia sp. CT11-108 TaxID=3393900 RepID=UPI0039A5B45C